MGGYRLLVKRVSICRELLRGIFIIEFRTQRDKSFFFLVQLYNIGKSKNDNLLFKKGNAGELVTPSLLHVLESVSKGNRGS